MYKKKKIIGYLFITKDITASKGYASKTFDMLVGLKLNGRIAGAKILSHKEPIIGMYTPDGKLILPKFTSQYKDLDIRIPTKVNLLKTEESGSIDGISSATVSAVLFNGAILRASRIVALSKGIRLNDNPVVDIINFNSQSFNSLLRDGSVKRLTILLSDLREKGISKPLLTNRSGVADIYRYKSLFKGNTPVASKQKEVKKGYKDTSRNLVLDLYIAPVATPTIGRNLLGDKWYDIFVAGRDPNEMTIVIATLGRYPLDGQSEISSGNFKRLTIIQKQKKIPLMKKNFRNLGFLHGKDKPYFAEVGLYRIPSETGINSVEPWKLEILLESKLEEENKKFYVDYKLDDKYIIKPDGLIKIANNKVPIWHDAWNNQKKSISFLIVTLLVLTFFLFKIDLISRSNLIRKCFRNTFLIWILIWLGWTAGGQVTILSFITILTLPINKGSLNIILADPLLCILLIYIAISFFIWGRGLYCGWLCPFGSLQELISNIGKIFKIPKIKISKNIEKNSLKFKYIVLFLLIAVGFIDSDMLDFSLEIEPFKTVISMKFLREWYFVSYAICLLIMGVFIERFFCRFICPLGAFMAIGGRLRIGNKLKRKEQCGSPCKLCAKECPINAINEKGQINMDECFYCLDCQSLYYNEHKCPPLVIQRKKISNNNLDHIPKIKKSCI